MCRRFQLSSCSREASYITICQVFRPTWPFGLLVDIIIHQKRPDTAPASVYLLRNGTELSQQQHLLQLVWDGTLAASQNAVIEPISVSFVVLIDRASWDWKWQWDMPSSLFSADAQAYNLDKSSLRLYFWAARFSRFSLKPVMTCSNEKATLVTLEFFDPIPGGYLHFAISFQSFGDFQKLGVRLDFLSALY